MDAATCLALARWDRKASTSLIVYLYGGQGEFAGTGDHQWNSPGVGSTHKFILFLARQVDESQGRAAETELSRFGFQKPHMVAGKRIAVEALNSPQMEVFQKNYEGALSEGSSIVWYP